MSRYTPFNTEIVDINNMRKEKMQLKFTKMQSNGNDYIYFNVMEQKIDNPEGLSVSLSDRLFGIGGEGVVLIDKSDIADAKIRIFNLDGSEGRMSGNAIRCVGKYLYDNGIVDKLDIAIETLSGIKKLSMTKKNGMVATVTVNMGQPMFAPETLPVKLEGDKLLNREIEIADGRYTVNCLSMGNPHCVIFAGDIEAINLEEIGPKFENDPIFPERVNTEFAKIIDSNVIMMRVWERGSGETMECGTGACAVTVAAVENGYCNKNEEIRIKLPKGEVTTRYAEDGTVYLTGDAKKIYDGIIEL